MDKPLDTNDPHYTVTLGEFAERLGRKREWVRRAFGKRAILKYNRLFFHEAEVAEAVAKQSAPTEFTVSRLELAARMAVDPRTAASRMNEIRAPCERRGRNVMYREDDVAKALRRAHNREYLNEEQVAALAGATPFQIYVLRVNPHYVKLQYKMPPLDRWGSRSAEWQRMSIEPWARAFAKDPSRFLSVHGLRPFRDAATPEIPTPSVQKDYESWMWSRKRTARCEEERKGEKKELPVDADLDQLTHDILNY